MTWKEITDVDEILALRVTGLLWWSPGIWKEPIPLDARSKCPSREEQLRFIGADNRYYLLLED